MTSWLGNQVPPDPKDNPLLAWMIGGKPRVSWEEFSRRAARVRRIWWPFEKLNPGWIKKMNQRILDSAKNRPPGEAMGKITSF